MRKNLLIFSILLLATIAQSQQGNVRYKSWETRLYTISSASAEMFLRTGKIDVDAFVNQTPAAVWYRDTLGYEFLPVGNYILVQTMEDQLTIRFHSQSNIRVFPINNKKQLQLEIRNSVGGIGATADVWVNGKKQNKKPGTVCTLKKAALDDAIIRIAIPGDTLFVEATALDDEWRTTRQQWWSNFYRTRPIWTISWPVRTAKKMIRTQPYYWFQKTRYKKSSKGYMVFNQPKYKPGDTVQFKAYVVTPKGKQRKKPVDATLFYNSRSGYVNTTLGKLNVTPAGSYVHSFILGDSLISDKDYTVQLVEEDGLILSGHFRIEDYILDDIASYSIRSEKKRYLGNDTLVFYAKAEDASGLPVMDGSVELLIQPSVVNDRHQQRVFIADTLWQGKKVVATEGLTRFDIPATAFPNADMKLNVLAVFKNSNNETHEERTAVELIKKRAFIDVWLDGSDVVAVVRKNGESIAATGTFSYNDYDDTAIQFPFRQKVNPLAEDYYFWAVSGADTLSEVFEPEHKVNISFGRIQQGDSAVFQLYNPLKLQVHYTVLYGNKVYASGRDSSENIIWKDKLQRKRMYTVTWNYVWNGRDVYAYDQIALLDKLLSADIGGSETVYPGQIDTITVSVKDYKGKPATAVNLTAASYNKQFGNSITVPEPPYLDRFKSRQRITIGGIELEEAVRKEDIPLGEHQGWRAPFGLDTMNYYQHLFPGKKGYSSLMPISDFQPQVSVFMTDNGKPVEVYMLYINKKLVWYNGVTDKRYVFKAPPGYVQLGIRLRDSYIEIDSVYLQPYYKTDISFDLHSELPNFKRTEQKPEYTAMEKRTLENQIIRVKETGAAYLWQGDKLARLESGLNVAGPFIANERIQFFKPQEFDLSFPFEPGYEYRLSREMARLEKIPMFGEKAILPNINTHWKLKDVLPPPPEIKYPEPVITETYLRANDHLLVHNGNGQLHISLPRDTVFAFAILYQKEDRVTTRIKKTGIEKFANVFPGTYSLILVTANQRFVEIPDIFIQDNGVTYLKIEKPVYDTANVYAELQHLKMLLHAVGPEPAPQPKTNIYTPVVLGMPLPRGNASLSGIIVDAEGKAPLAGATISLKGYDGGVTTDTDGSYKLSGIKPGQYTVIISFVGYEAKSVQTTLESNVTRVLDAGLSMSENSLEEVVVVGYGVQRKSNLTGSVTTVSASLISSLQGAVAGVSVTSGNIAIRGINSTNLDHKPLYVVNGVPMDELPPTIDMSKAQVNIMKGEAAIVLYGARAAAGVIVIVTDGFAPKAIRETFRDYGYWQPDLLTDKDGKARFVVTYPDNITGWESWVIGMDKKKRILKTSRFVKSFKPMVAQLSLPAFLVEGDRAIGVGKLNNYTEAVADINTKFLVNDSLFQTNHTILQSKAAAVEKLSIHPANTDTLKLRYSMETNGGYTDGEIRNIPVYRKGTEESRGHFWSLDADTTFTFQPDTTAGEVTLYAQNNTLEVLLDELRYLKEYPYFCMEQTASKLTGLLLEKQIRKTQNQPFEEQKDIEKLSNRLLTSQGFDGSWGWWPGGKANFSITNYIIHALLLMKEDPLIQPALRNGGLYLQNELPEIKKYKTWNRQAVISNLYTLSLLNNVMDYTAYLHYIPFDSLTLHQQWQVISIKQQQKLDYQREMATVMMKKTETQLGGLYWGKDSWSWESNEVATTLLAYNVLRQDKTYEHLAKRLVYYFLERRSGGRWRNTVESASICAAILPDILKVNAAFRNKAKLTIKNNNTIVTDSFPFKVKLDSKLPVQIDRTGGGLLFVTGWQKIFNPTPEPVSENFVVRSWFERSDKTVKTLNAGEKVIMHVTVDALKSAEYVLIEIPIPAGCTYGAKPQQWKEHREYLKDKQVIFVENMHSGMHHYEIELEPRYTGEYHLNPAKVSLMYFPVLYGRNGMSQINIAETADK